MVPAVDSAGIRPRLTTAVEEGHYGETKIIKELLSREVQQIHPIHGEVQRYLPDSDVPLSSHSVERSDSKQPDSQLLMTESHELVPARWFTALGQASHFCLISWTLSCQFITDRLAVHRGVIDCTPPAGACSRSTVSLILTIPSEPSAGTPFPSSEGSSLRYGHRLWCIRIPCI